MRVSLPRLFGHQFEGAIAVAVRLFNTAVGVSRGLGRKSLPVAVSFTVFLSPYGAARKW